MKVLQALRWISILATVLAFLVVTLGAYTRLTDAGLGCPDWPGCYGRLVLPSEHQALAKAQREYPTLPIESRKAWTEMLHRYAAGTLACFIVLLGIGAYRLRAQGGVVLWRISAVLMLLVVFQALLGMWTVTLKLLPIVVMGHLLGGVCIFSLLGCFAVRIWKGADNPFPVSPGVTPLPRYRFAIIVGVLLVFMQIALGGWVSANYAGIACLGFPQCNGMWFPTLHASQGFYLFSPVGANYQGGLLDSEARMTIQWVHRVGAIVVATYVLGLSAWLLTRSTVRSMRILAGLAMVFVLVQFTLGVLNVVYLLPLHVAVAHNGVAALLLATMFVMLCQHLGGLEQNARRRD